MKKLIWVMGVSLLMAPLTGAQFRDFFWSQTGGGPEGGYLYDVEVAPPNGNLIFLATEDAGLFRSLDGGQVWDKAGLYDLTIRTVAVNPLNRNVVYAGTWDGRIFKSTDQGETWVEMIEGLPGSAVMDMVVHPSQPDLIVAGTYGDGIYISDDAGETWVASNDGISDDEINRIIIDPNDNDVVYAGVYNNSVPLNISTDRGATWASLSDGLPGSTCRDIHVFRGDSNIIFVALQGDYAYRTLDGGTTWERMDSDQGITDDDAYTVRIHPTDPTIAWLGTRYDGVFKTVDGGDNWEQMGDEDFEPYVRFLAQHPTQSDTLFLATQDGLGMFKTEDGGDTWMELNNGLTNIDIQCLAIHPNTQNLLYAGTRSRGVFRSTNYGRTWEERNVQLGPQNIYCLATAGLEVYAGTSSGIYRGLDGGNIWAELTEGIDYSDDIYAIAINPDNASNIVLGSVSVSEGDDYAGGVYYTTNKGEEWIAANIDLDYGDNITVRDLVFAQPSGRMYAATSRGVYRSNNNGQSWTTTAYINHDVECVTFDARDGGRIYAGTEDGIYLSGDDGDTWEPMVAFIEARDMAVDGSRNPSWVYAVAEGGVFVSEDNGINWSTVNYGLTNRHVECVVIDGFDPDILYAGTLGSGVFTTADATPPEVPTVLDAHALDRGVHLSWQLGSENDLAGYNVYYDTDSATPPFDGMMAMEGASPVDVGLNTSLSLFGFTNDQPVYVCVTAYDEVGNESYYSAVQTLTPNIQPQMVMAGYGDTYLTGAGGGSLDIIAWAMDAGGDTVSSVEMVLYGEPLDFQIPSIGGGIFQLTLPLPGGMAPFQQVFELMAVDENGTRSPLWPYLHVRQPAWSSQMSTGYEYWERPVEITPWWRHRSQFIADPPTGSGPFIYAAGYNMSEISTEAGGMLNMVALAIDYQAQITGVELYYAGMPTGLMLKDDGKSGDFAAGDGIYGMIFNLAPGSMPAMDYQFELKAYNSTGHESDLWPYLVVR